MASTRDPSDHDVDLTSGGGSNGQFLWISGALQPSLGF